MSTSFQQNRPIVVDSELPAQTAATNGKALISNGMTASWQTILGMIGTNAGQVTSTQFLNAVLPSQTGNVGKVLQTDGSNSTWVMEPTGFTGSRGAQGFTGSSGSAGASVTGFTGSKGDVGFTGSTGGLGFTGSVGYTGSTPSLAGYATEAYVQTAGKNSQGAKTVSASAPTGTGTPGDVWYVI